MGIGKTAHLKFAQILAGIVAQITNQESHLTLMNRIEIFIYTLCLSLILKGGITPEFETQFRTLCELIVYAWSLAVVNLVFCGGALRTLGVRPRTSIGLLGILTSPFLHSSWEHLVANTVPFFILGSFVILGGIRDFLILTVFTPLFSGLGIWLFGQPYTNHIGASDIIFGYLGFLLVRSYFANDALSIVLTIVVGFMYGRTLWGIFPGEEGVSWEGHFFGLIAGVLVASFLDVFRVMLPASINGGL
jgi:membrane associated rhomboid family serine protease